MAAKKKGPKKKSGEKPKRPSPDPNVAAFDAVNRLLARSTFVPVADADGLQVTELLVDKWLKALEPEKMGHICSLVFFGSRPSWVVGQFD